MFYYVHLVSGPKGKSAPWCAYDKRHRSSTAKSPSRLRCVRQSLQTANACRRYGLLWVRLGSRVTQSRLPLFPQQQTFLSPAVTSEKCQLLTHATQQTASLFDHLVRTQQQRRRHLKPECLRSFYFNDEFEFGRLTNGHV